MQNNADRGIIKWAPFNSVMNPREIINDINYEKNSENMPTLSDEQRLLNEKMIIEAYYENINVNIKFFYNNKILLINSKIKKIDFNFKKIYLSNKTILFDQIINISI